MGQIKITRTVDAPVAEVFRVYSSFEGAASFVEGIKDLTLLTEGPVGVGTRFRETRVMFGKEATEEMEITAFDPPNRYTVGCTSCGARYESQFDFRADGDRTQIEMTMNIKALSLGAKLMAPLGFLMKGTMKKCMTADMDDLDAELARRRASGSNLQEGSAES